MSDHFIITKRCGNIYTGYLNPGDEVFVHYVVINTQTNAMRAEVESPHTGRRMDVPVGSLAGLREAMRNGTVTVKYWTPGSFDYEDA